MAEFDDFAAQLLSDPAYMQGAAAGLAASNADDDPALSFFDNVRRTALESLDQAPANGEAPTVIVLSENPRTDAKSVNGAIVSRLVDINLKKPEAWQGLLVFCAAHGTAGWSLPLPNGSIEDALDLLENHGFGNVPVAIFYPNRRTLSCFQEGSISSDKPIRLNLPAANRQVTIQDIFVVLEDVRRNSLLTPMIGPPHFWTKGDDYVPGEEAERQIQWIVAAQLRSNFRPMIIDTEQVTVVGRIDVVITDPNAQGVCPRHPAIIELKALRSKTHNSKAVANSVNVRATLKGLRQAKAYRHEKAAKFAVLACFDMRENKDDILNTPLCVLARQKYFTDGDIAAYTFPVYGDPAHAQEEMAVGA